MERVLNGIESRLLELSTAPIEARAEQLQRELTERLRGLLGTKISAAEEVVQGLRDIHRLYGELFSPQIEQLFLKVLEDITRRYKKEAVLPDG